MRRLLMLLCGLLALPAVSVAQSQPVKLKAGMVTGIDQVGLPIALERGFFEKWGLDVSIARPYATGVDALNALQAGLPQSRPPDRLATIECARCGCKPAGQAASPPSFDRHQSPRSTSPAP